MTVNTLEILLTGATAAAVVKLLDNVIQWWLNRKAKREDTESEKAAAAEKKKEKDIEEWRDETDKKIAALMEGQKVSLLDRIQHLGRTYLKGGEIDFDDRRRLHQMHTAYHNLGGNGDLDTLMEDVDELPLKPE